MEGPPRSGRGLGPPSPAPRERGWADGCDVGSTRSAEGRNRHVRWRRDGTDTPSPREFSGPGSIIYLMRMPDRAWEGGVWGVIEAGRDARHAPADRADLVIWPDKRVRTASPRLVSRRAASCSATCQSAPCHSTPCHSAPCQPPALRAGHRHPQREPDRSLDRSEAGPASRQAGEIPQGCFCASAAAIALAGAGGAGKLFPWSAAAEDLLDDAFRVIEATIHAPSPASPAGLG